MKNIYSQISVAIIILLLILIRINYWEQAINVFQWDALGYYIYLPAKFIYHDVAYLKWWSGISNKYHFSQDFYQASMQPNGKYVFFYSIGIALLETPFFFIGHWTAGFLHYSQDGFSTPYQISISIGMLVYVTAGLIFLRKILLYYFEDTTVAFTIFLVAIATNYPQYTAIEAGITHGYLFTIYCILIYFSIKWHDSPKIIYAGIIGMVIGLATVIRPTEAISIFIPLLWKTQTLDLRKKKFLLIRKKPSHLFAAVFGGFISLLPQLIYWKEVTGNWVYKMGSKWDFLSPHWKVLFGWEKGWIIYTPVVILFVLGLFKLGRKEFSRSVIIYFILNTWIIIAWHEWRFGASYSSRAFTQSLAVMALPCGVMVQWLFNTRFKVPLILTGIYFCGVNLFQVWQYNRTIIHYNDMNRKYYAAIYLNPYPTPIDMSLLDTDECIQKQDNYILKTTVTIDSVYRFNGAADSSSLVLEKELSSIKNISSEEDTWMKTSAYVKSDWGAFNSNIKVDLTQDSVIKSRSIRMENGICDFAKWNKIEFYFKIPSAAYKSKIRVTIHSPTFQNVGVKNFTISFYQIR